MGNTDALVFNDIRFDVIDRNGQPWFKASQVSAALGYAREDKIARLYQRNADEFTESMTQVIEIVAEPHYGTGLSNGRMRIFSLRGCHLLAMFARTAVAKAFRVWVLDVLETLNKEGQPVTSRHALPKAKPGPKPKALPVSELTLADKGIETMERILRLRADVFRASVDVRTVLTSPFVKGPYNSETPEHQREFANALNEAASGFFMAINSNLNAVEQMFRAYIEGEKMLRRG